MDDLREANGNEVAAASHPRTKARTRFSRYNPMNKIQWKRNKATHPVGHPKVKTRTKLNYVNPLYYIRRIKSNLTGGQRSRNTVGT